MTTKAIFCFCFKIWHDLTSQLNFAYCSHGRMLGESLEVKHVLWMFSNSSHGHFYLTIKIVFKDENIFFPCSEETGEEGVLKKGGRGPGIRAVATSGWKSNRQNSSGRSKDSQEITYVPTSVLKGAGPAKTDSIDVEVTTYSY